MQRRNYASLLCIWLHTLFSNCQLNAQSLTSTLPYLVSVKHLTLEQGLPNRTAVTVGQDQHGFVWIGTLDKAYQFDGQRFMPLPLANDTPKRQSYNPDINQIMTDRQGNLWLASSIVAGSRKQSILKCHETQAQSFDSAFHRPDPFKSDLIYTYVPTSKNTFQYVRTKSGMLWRHLGQGLFKPLRRVPELAGTFVHSLYETDQQTLLLSYPTNSTTSTSELIELDSTGRVLQHRRLPNWLRPFRKMADGTIYLNRVLDYGSSSRQTIPSIDALVYQLKPDGTLSALPIRPDQHTLPDPVHYSFGEVSVSFDSFRGLFWLSGPHLLLAWHPQHGIVFDLAKTDFPIATTQKLSQVFIDRTGAVWVPTTNGIIVLTLEPTRFQRYLHIADTRSVANRQAIRGMMLLKDQLWVNSSECQLVNLKTGKSRFPFQKATTDRTYTINLCPVVRGGDGMIWSAARGIIQVDPQTLKFKPIPLQLDNNCVTIWPSGRHTCWVGYTHGLSIFDTKQQKNLPFTGYNQFSELAQSRVNGFFADKQTGSIWIAASSGLYLLDTLRGITARYSTGDKTLPFDHITFVHPDPDQPHVYWLATSGGGLIRWNRRQGNYQQFTQKQGLSDNTLYAIYEDKQHRLWLPSNYGLMSFQRLTHQIQIYHTKNGIADEEFNLIAHYRAPDGRLFLGGLNGITAFWPDQINTEKPMLAPLLLTQFRKLDTETGMMVNHFTDFQQEKQIHLTATDRLFSLSFGLLDYRHLGQSRLWYRLVGWQEKWVAQEHLALSINGLPSGDYTLQVRAQTINGDWASPILSIPIIVDKPIFLRSWFILLSLVVIIIGIMLIFRWRNWLLVTEKLRLEAEVARRTAQIEQDKAIIEQQAADLQANATLKSRFFANVSHEFRTPLTLLLGPLQFLSKRIKDSATQQLLSAMERNTQQLLTLVNDLLDLTRLDIRQLKLTEQPADLAQVIHQTIINFMPQAHYTGVSLSVTGIDTPCWMMLDTKKIETVLRNLIANALHYTSPGGAIQISLYQTNGQAHIQIKDSGSGIHPNDLPHIFERYFQSNQPDKPLRGGTGIGLALCQEYCLLWGGDITVKSQLGKGSTFTVVYPIWQSIQPVEPVVNQRTQIPSVSDGLKSLPALLFTEKYSGDSTTQSGILILVVDDNPDMIFYIKTILSPYYDLLTAQNGREAWTLLNQLDKEQLPNLIISDIMMPEIDGLTLVNQLHQTPDLCHIPIVLLTARTDLESRLKALQLGIADYLTKPFFEAELLARVHNLLKRFDEKIAWQQQPPIEQEKSSIILTDVEWIQFAQQIIRDNLTNSFFNLKLFAEMIHLSERQLYRRTKELMGLSPNQLIQEVRLQVAHELLEKQPDLLIKSVAYQIGYKKTSYFIQLYRERFGVNPGELQRQSDKELEEVNK